MRPLIDEPAAAVSDRLAERTQDLLDQKRVLATERQYGVDYEGRPFHYAYVMGDDGPHLVRASQLGVSCDCTAGKFRRPCAHKYAAMAVWAEQGYGDE